MSESDKALIRNLVSLALDLEENEIDNNGKSDLLKGIGTTTEELLSLLERL